MLRVVAGDVQLDTTLDGQPLEMMATIVGHAVLSVDADQNTAHLTLAGDPAIYAEMIEGPSDVPGTFFSSTLEELGPQAVASLVGSVPLPLPVLPLDAVAGSLQGRQLRLAPPAEVVTGEPHARVTLYGRFSAQ
jgi:hypothetical protein